MISEEKKPVRQTNKLITTLVCWLGLLFCCYCGIFVFPWGASELIIAFGLVFLGVVMMVTFSRWLPASQAKNKNVFFLVWAIVAVAGVFGIGKLRGYYAESQLNKYGVRTTGEVVSLFKERRGRYGTTKVDMARVAYRAGDVVAYNAVENKKKYLTEGDRMKLVYSSKDPDIFQVLSHSKAEPPTVYTPTPSNIAVIDSPPMFRGDMPGLYAYLQAHVEYPQEARDQGISGKVFISFVITQDGSVTDVKVEKGIGGGCDEAAVRAVSNMPKWRPGVQKGKPVRVKYHIPLSFSL